MPPLAHPEQKKAEEERQRKLAAEAAKRALNEEEAKAMREGKGYLTPVMKGTLLVWLLPCVCACVCVALELGTALTMSGPWHIRIG